MNIYKEFNERRTAGNQKIMDTGYLPLKRFFALDSRAYGEGEIPEKYKEMMGLVASAVLRCNDCISYHIGKCHEQGCSRKELTEALNIAVVVGGSIVIPHIRHAFDLIDELYDS